MWTPEEKTILKRGRDILELSWNQLGKLFGRNRDTCRKMYLNEKEIEIMGPKVVARKSKITPQVAREIKS